MRSERISPRLTFPLGTRLYRRALTAGFVRGDIRWRRVLYALWVWRLLRRVVARRPETVAVERVRSGQTVVVTGTTRR